MAMSLRDTPGSVRVNYAVCFSDSKGQPKSSVEKAQTKLLALATPLLQPILETDEEILYAAESITPFSVLEWLTTGWIITTVKRSLLVVTNHRLLHLPVKPNLRPRGSVSEIRYGDASSLAVTGVLNKKLVVSYRDGRTEAFTIVRREPAAKLSALLPEISRSAAMSAEPGRHFLCPRCARRLQPAIEQCPACGQAFKNRRRAVFWSLIAPGGGYFYTGHPVLGLMDAGAETVLLIGLIFSIVSGLGGEADAWPVALIVGVVLAIEKLLTIFHASHYVAEFLPASSSAG
ncbi:MAG TPA: hypothetical protein VGX68_18215 [Thermoanaerobaculia bacterium]|jgi:hypothetical protein|nr:hypothetical protein [Thermoanaerobaculia bacterium]